MDGNSLSTAIEILTLPAKANEISKVHRSQLPNLSDGYCHRIQTWSQLPNLSNGYCHRMQTWLIAFSSEETWFQLMGASVTLPLPLTPAWDKVILFLLRVASLVALGVQAVRFQTSNKLKFCKTLSGLPWWLSGKESPCNAEDPGSILGSGRSPRKGHGNPLQYSCLENPMDREA